MVKAVGALPQLLAIPEGRAGAEADDVVAIVTVVDAAAVKAHVKAGNGTDRAAKAHDLVSLSHQRTSWSLPKWPKAPAATTFI